MGLTRVYLPLDAAALSEVRVRGELGPVPLRAHAAATPRPTLSSDDEEREYAAWSAAAAEAGERVGSAALRVVASADVDAAVVTRLDESGTLVELGAAVPLSRIASFHIDEEPGGDIANLLWYDVTELDDIIALTSS